MDISVVETQAVEATTFLFLISCLLVIAGFDTPDEHGLLNQRNIYGTLYFARTLPLGSNNCASSPDCQTGSLSPQYRSITVFVPEAVWICTAPFGWRINCGKTKTFLSSSRSSQFARLI